MAQEVNAAILVVSHLRKPAEGSHEEGGRVRLADLRGSGAIAQLGHTAIAVERDQQDETNGARFRVLKCRYAGHLLGAADHVVYNPETTRLEAKGPFDVAE